MALWYAPAPLLLLLLGLLLVLLVLLLSAPAGDSAPPNLASLAALCC